MLVLIVQFVINQINEDYYYYYYYYNSNLFNGPFILGDQGEPLPDKNIHSLPIFVGNIQYIYL